MMHGVAARAGVTLSRRSHARYTTSQCSFPAAGYSVIICADTRPDLLLDQGHPVQSFPCQSQALQGRMVREMLGHYGPS